MSALAWTATQVLTMRPIVPIRATYAMHTYRESRRPMVVEWIQSQRKDWAVSQLAEHMDVQPRTAMDWVYQMIAEGLVERVRISRGGHPATYRTVR